MTTEPWASAEDVAKQPGVADEGCMTTYTDQDRKSLLADLQDERILNEKRRHGDRPFDVQPVRGATLDDKLVSHNRIAVDFTSGPIEQRTQTYPLAALQQLVRNAVLHRAYEGTNAPVRVYWYDDRIEIMSPGGPFGEVSAESFGKGATDYRNPNLAEALRVLGFVQHYGAGIPMAERELKKNGNPPPEFHVEATHVRVTVRMASSTGCPRA